MGRSTGQLRTHQWNARDWRAPSGTGSERPRYCSPMAPPRPVAAWRRVGVVAAAVGLTVILVRRYFAGKLLVADDLSNEQEARPCRPRPLRLNRHSTS